MTPKLIIKTSFKNDDEFIDYAKKNLQTLMRGWVPSRKDVFRPVAGEKGTYELSRKYDCLEYYRHASVNAKAKKIPFFIYWLLLKKGNLLNRAGIKRLFDKEFRIESGWVTEVENIINKLSSDSTMNHKIRVRLEAAYNSLKQQKYRIFLRYQQKETAKKAILGIAREGLLFEPIKAEILEFISRRGITTWRELRRYKRKLQRIRPDLLDLVLEDLEKEGRISSIVRGRRKFLILRSDKNLQ